MSAQINPLGGHSAWHCLADSRAVWQKQSLRQLCVQVAELPDVSGAHFMPVTQKGQALLLSAIKDGTIPL